MPIATITATSTANIPNISNGFNHTIGTVLTADANTYHWTNTSGDSVILTGTFNYLAGVLDAATSSVDSINLFQSGSPGADLTVSYTIASTDVADITTGSSSVFWRALLNGDTNFVLAGDTGSADPNFLIDGFAGHARVSSSTLFGSNTFEITGSGTYAGNVVRATTGVFLADTININRSDASDDIFASGDTLNGALTSANSVTGGDDTITDTSTAAGLTYLVGDMGDSYAAISVVGGFDTITGSNNSSVIVGDVWAFSDDTSLTLTGGADILSGGSNSDLLVGDIYDADSVDGIGAGGGANTIFGGDDTINGGAGNDLIYGEYVLMDISTVTGGDDIIDGGSGRDQIFGQTGNDEIKGQNGADTIFGGQGNDRIIGGGGADTIDGEDGNDTIVGSKGNDTINGGDGLDSLSGSEGNDTIDGGDGVDTLNAGGGKDTLSGGAGNDTMYGDGGADTLNGNGGVDTMFGGTGADIMNGGNDGDYMEGGSHGDTIDGGGGGDEIIGGTGNDTLTGGSGADVFVFEDGWGADTITDFASTRNAEDIDLSAVTAITNFADLDANHMNQVGSDVVIDDLAGNTITLLGVTLSDLGNGDFIF